MPLSRALASGSRIFAFFLLLDIYSWLFNKLLAYENIRNFNIDQIYEIAFSYYIHFYSYKGKFYKLWPGLLLVASFGIGFVASVIFSFPGLSKRDPDDLTLLWSFKWVLIFEILFLISAAKLKGKRDKLLTNDYSRHSKKYQLILAKRKWIKGVCNKTEVEYLDFIQYIRQLQDASRAPMRQETNWRQILMGYIYNSDAKTRITSYIIFFMSLASLLSIKDSSGLSELLPTFFDSSYQRFMIFIMVLSCVLFLIFIGSIYLIKFAVVAIDTWLSVAGSAKRNSYIFVDIFIEDMASMHRLPKLSIASEP